MCLNPETNVCRSDRNLNVSWKHVASRILTSPSHDVTFHISAFSFSRTCEGSRTSDVGAPEGHCIDPIMSTLIAEATFSRCLYLEVLTSESSGIE